MRAAGGWLVLVFVLALAGCGGHGSVTGGGDRTPTLTPVDVPAPAPTPARARDLPPGLAPTGVTDPLALAGAHAGRLSNRSYTVRSVVTIRYANGTLRGRRAATARVGAGGNRYHVAYVAVGPAPPFRPMERAGAFERTAGRSVFWSDGDRLLQIVTRGNETRYRAVPPGEYDPSRWRYLTEVGRKEEMYLFFQSVETTTSGRVDRNGTTLVRIDSTGGAKLGSFEEALSVGAVYEYPLAAGFETVSEVTLTAFVDREGIVREVRFAYVVRMDGRRIRVTQRVRYAAIGTTEVGRPPWYAAANRTTRSTPARRSGADRVPAEGRADPRGKPIK